MDRRDFVAIVTGGATGIGRSVSLRLARNGAAAVVMSYSRSAADAGETEAEVAKAHCQALAVRSNVAVESESRALVRQTLDRFRRLDFLINAAGFTEFVPHTDLDALTDDLWDRTHQVNVKGLLLHSSSGGRLGCFPGLCGQHIIHRGCAGGGLLNPYAVSKAGVLERTRSLALALAPRVRVNAVIPGFVATRWNRRHLSPAEAAEQEERLAGETPLGRVAGQSTLRTQLLGS